MRDIPAVTAFLAIATGIGMFTIGILTDMKPPVKDAVTYNKCLAIHPVRYCGITYMGLK